LYRTGARGPGVGRRAQTLEGLLVLAFEDDLTGVAAVLERIPGGGPAGLGTGAGGIPGVQPIG